MTASSTFHRLIDTALVADLSKNEYKIILALLRQTLGYGKASDPLTPNRLSRITGIRKDRLEKAILGVVETGIFQRSKHAIFKHQYTINAEYLPKDATPLYSPSIPKNRNLTQKTETQPEKWEHTDTTATTIYQNTTTERRGRDLNKPQNVDLSTYETLLPALTKLQTPTAQNVLDVLSCAITQHSIKTTPIRLGFGLIRQAHAGMLDTTCLQIKHQQQQQAQSRQDNLTKAMRAAEINGLRQQAQLLGISLKQHAKNLNQMHLVEMVV